MIDAMLSNLAPHLCYGCGKIGMILCPYCANNITDEPFAGCFECGLAKDVASTHTSCHPPYQNSWCVSERRGVIERIIDAYKFEYVKSASWVLAGLLDETLPVLPDNTVIVPIPTIPKHIRQRGYDHMDLICRDLARRRGLKVERLLKRKHNSMQRGASRQQRIDQAKSAFVCSRSLDRDALYLIIDDVVTTGSTLKYGAVALESAGAKTILVAAIARQTLD